MLRPRLRLQLALLRKHPRHHPLRSVLQSPHQHVRQELRAAARLQLLSRPHKTSIRGGIGLYYESSVWNNLSNANGFQKTGLIYAAQPVCGGVNTFTIPGSTPGTTTTLNSIDGIALSSLCAQPIATSASHLINLQTQYRNAINAQGPALNSGYLPQNLTASGLFSPNYKAPYSIQFNGGVQQELWKGSVLSVDYVHNATQRISETVDINHNGAARTLNVAAATSAIAATTMAANCVGGASAAAVNCAIAARKTINDFSGNGLDSGNVVLSGNPAAYKKRTVATGAAFPGVNPLLGTGAFILPIGRSGYDAMQVVLRQQQTHPVPGVQNANYQISYSLSRNTSNSVGANGDEFFSASPFDYDQTTSYMGPNPLDHLHSINMGGSFLLRYGPRLSVIGHFYSAPPTNLYLDSGGSGTAAIFQTDVTGDGSGAGSRTFAQGDLVPGTNPGAYMRQYSGKNLSQLINNYNSSQAGTLTPAGQALVSAGLFSQAQLAALGAVKPTIAPMASPTALNNPMFRTFDTSFSYPIRLGHYLHALGESVSLEPTVSMYNVFNMANYNNPSGVLISTKTAAGTGGVAAANYLNGPNTDAVQNTNRIQRGAGTFSQGAPRSTEFALKLNF